MDVVLTPGAGLAVHQQTVMACRVTPDSLGQQADGLLEVQECGTRRRDWWAWSDGWSEAGVTHVAMASTGAYGQPVDHLREGTWTVLVVNAAQVTHVPGRQTDRAEARWRAQLRRQGWLQASVIPRAEPRERRDLPRSRTPWVPERSREVNRGPGVLARATIQVAAVAAASMGGAGRAILAAVIEGRAAPAAMAAWATGCRRRKLPGLEPALPGWVREHHRRWVARPRAHLDVLEAPLDALSADIARRRTALRATPPPAASVGATGGVGSAAAPAPPAPPLTCARAVTGLDLMPGVNQWGGERWVAEGGIAMARLGTAARLAAWSGVAPGHDDSAGTPRAGQTRQGHRALRTGLTPWAHAAAGPQTTSLAALSHRLAARRGQTRALMAVAPSIVVSACSLLSRHASSHA